MKASRIGLIKLFIVALLLLSAANVGAEVYINNSPVDITVTEGAPLDIPIFFLGGNVEGKPVELFIWREGLETHQIQYYALQNGQAEWTSQPQPLLAVNSMDAYNYVVWNASDSTSGVESFKLTVCLDGTVDGVFTENNSTCGQRIINIEKTDTPPPPTNSCTLSVSPSSISKTLRRSVSPVTVPISVSCNGSKIDFGAAAVAPNNWLSLYKKGVGDWDAVIVTAPLDAGKSYSATIQISSASGSAQIPVSLTVQSVSIGPGTPSTCTPSTARAWPSPVTISAAAGATATATASITDNCNSVVSYSSAIATSDGGWLSAAPSGSGSITLTAKTTSSMSGGTYIGTVQVIPVGSAYASFSFNVILTIEGPCTTTSAVISPPSISQSAVLGSNASSTALTVKDNCQNALPYTVNDVVYRDSSGAPVTPPVNWISAPLKNTAGNGSLTVTFAAASLPAAQYRASITVTPQGYSPIEVPVTLTVSQAPSTNTDMTVLQNRALLYFDLGAYPDYKLYKYYAIGQSATNKGLQIGLADMTQYSGLGDSDLIVKYAPNCDSEPAPTSAQVLADWKTARDYWAAHGNSSFIGGTWQPARAREDLYYKLSSQSFEFVEIPNNPPGCYYITVINTLSTPESAGPPYYSLRLTVADLDGY